MFNFTPHLLTAVGIALSCAIGGEALAEAIDVNLMKAAYKRPTVVPFPETPPYSPQLATLGKMLFFDPRLSGAQNLSCASCHNPSFGFEVPVPGAVGSANTPLNRKALTILNSAWSPHLFWDGRAKSLEAQAEGPITSNAEMNSSFDTIVARIKNVNDYKQWFGQIFTDGVTVHNILSAIATYERTVVAGWSPFDRWVEGDESAISDAAKRGFVLFNAKAGCSGCHSGWNFTDNKFHDIGISTDDIGRAKLEPDNLHAMHAFKTPGLRNLTYRGPFMHHGQLPDLSSVLMHYEGGGEKRPSLDPLMKPYESTDKERDDLLAFLAALTADKTETPLPNLPN